MLGLKYKPHRLSEKPSRKSTSAGSVQLGKALVRFWSKTQALVALSSGEAELHGVVNGAARGLWLKHVFQEMGLELQVIVGTDSEAARGMTETWSRQGETP